MGFLDFYPAPKYPDAPQSPNVLPAPDAQAETIVQVAYSPKADAPAGKRLTTTDGTALRFTAPSGASSVHFRLGPTEAQAGATMAPAWCAGIRRDAARGAAIKPGDVITVVPIWLAEGAIPEDALTCEVQAVFGSK